MMGTTNLLVRTLICVYFMLILMTRPTWAFMILTKKSISHQDITRDAILQTTASVCRMQGRLNFDPPGALTVESVAKYCNSSDSAKNFQRSISRINKHNALVDIWHPFTGSRHFDNEEFLAGRDHITRGLSAVKYSVKQQSFEAARKELGRILHTLQDFYSHSNWIELGNTKPYSNLIKADTPINDKTDSETCRQCSGKDCTDNILEEVISQQKLTSGYFGLSKPKGKCSHGGFFDPSSFSTGGINKDAKDSSHGHLHEQAASVATNATKELLQDIRLAVGDSEFLRLMGLSQASVLCFVVDTTSNMAEDIDEVRRITSSIINSKTGTAAQHSEYILVPFNDPDYGPLSRTTDPNVFKKQLNKLKAVGGGDAPEMCFSGLQLALTGSPPQTEIFVFTDADTKDKGLRNTLRALIEETKSVVTFILTSTISSINYRRNRRNENGLQVSPILDSQVYQDLAQASGGLAIEITKGELSEATNIIAVTSRSTLVTLFQAARTTAKAEIFSVFVDSTVKNLTIYIKGSSPEYVISSPSGVSQNNTELNGSLGLIQKVGNFHTVQPIVSDPVGMWHFRIKSTQPYSIKVVGQSEVDFLFDFVTCSQDPHSSYAVLNSRPAANTNVTLLVSIVGGDGVLPTAVSLVNASNSNSFNGTLNEVDNGQYLVNFNTIPAGEFTVNVVGQTSSNVYFQRQSPTQFRTSSVTITTEPVGTTEPGKEFTLPFTVATTGSGGHFIIKTTNDRNFKAFYNTSITLESGSSVNETVTLTVPENTSSGTDVTVTIEVKASDGSDFNYAVWLVAIVAPVTDITRPVCGAVTLHADCSGECSLSSWSLTANMTDESGIQSVRALHGNGNLNTTSVLSDTEMNTTMVAYSSSCCFQELELVAVDEVGNVATCFAYLRATAAPSIFSYGAQHFLWLNIGFYQFIQL